MMKRYISLLFLFGSVFTLNAGTINQSFGEVSTVEFIGNYKIEMVKSDSNYISVVNKDGKVNDDQIEISVQNFTLKMMIQRDTYVERDIIVKVHYQSIDKIVVRRGARLECDTIETEKVSISAFSGGKVKLGVKANQASVEIKSGGSVRLYGKANSANYSINAGGVIGASFMDVKSVVASIQAGGEIILNALEMLEASVKAGGSISYKGEPTIISQSVKLGGTIESIHKTERE